MLPCYFQLSCSVPPRQLLSVCKPSTFDSWNLCHTTERGSTGLQNFWAAVIKLWDNTTANFGPHSWRHLNMLKSTHHSQHFNYPFQVFPALALSVFLACLIFSILSLGMNYSKWEGRSKFVSIGFFFTFNLPRRHFSRQEQLEWHLLLLFSHLFVSPQQLFWPPNYAGRESSPPGAPKINYPLRWALPARRVLRL